VSGIRRLFPDAKILFLYRDGRDVALSLTHVPWMSSDVHVNFLVWLYYYRILRQERMRCLPSVCLVRYEDLVAEPDREFGRILSFLDLPYESAVADGHGNTEGVPRREYAWKARALEPITTERIGVSRRELSRVEIEIMERLGSRPLESLGYKLISDGRRALSLRFMLGLGFGLTRLIYDLPWHSLFNEFIGRSLLCPLTSSVAGPNYESLAIATRPKSVAELSRPVLEAV
jgi:hypothetical protein